VLGKYVVNNRRNIAHDDNYIMMWSCPGNMPKYYSTKYHNRNLHEV